MHQAAYAAFETLRKEEALSALKKEIEEIMSYITEHNEAPTVPYTSEYKKVIQAFKSIFDSEIFSFEKIDEGKIKMIHFLLDKYGCAPLHDVIDKNFIRNHVEYMIRNVLMKQCYTMDMCYRFPVQDENKEELLVHMHLDHTDFVEKYMKQIVDLVLTTDQNLLKRLFELNKDRKYLHGGHQMFGASEDGAAFNSIYVWKRILQETYIKRMGLILRIPANELQVKIDRSSCKMVEQVASGAKIAAQFNSSHWDTNPLRFKESNETIVQSKIGCGPSPWCGLLGCTPETVQFLLEKKIIEVSGKSVSLWTLPKTTLIQQCLHALCTTLALEPGVMCLWLNALLHKTQPEPDEGAYKPCAFNVYGLTPVKAGSTHQTDLDVYEAFYLGLSPSAYPNATGCPKEIVRGRVGLAKRGYNFYESWYAKSLIQLDWTAMGKLEMLTENDGSPVTHTIQNPTELLTDEKGEPLPRHLGKRPRKRVPPKTFKTWKPWSMYPKPKDVLGGSLTLFQQILVGIKNQDDRQKDNGGRAEKQAAETVDLTGASSDDDVFLIEDGAAKRKAKNDAGGAAKGEAKNDAGSRAKKQAVGVMDLTND